MSLKQLADRIAFNTEFKTEIPNRSQHIIECERPEDNVGVKIELYEGVYEYIGKGEVENNEGYTESEDELINILKEMMTRK